MMRQQVAQTLVATAAVGFVVWKKIPQGGWGAMQIAGMGLTVGGLVLWMMARFQLGESFSITAQARKLVTHGLYAKIRNPIYVFGSWIIAGLILLFGKPVWLAVFLVIIPLQIWRARKEAGVLEAKFGEEYRSYRAGTWF